jgi:hypothetical protein
VFIVDVTKDSFLNGELSVADERNNFMAFFLAEKDDLGLDDAHRRRFIGVDNGE